MHKELAQSIQSLFDQVSQQSRELSPQEAEQVETAIQLLNQGKVRIAEKQGREWTVNQWAKQAVLLYFRIKKMTTISAGDLQFFDKIPLKKWSESDGVRVVPHALVRVGAYVAPGAILMPSYVNIGAYVDSGSMVDTWATVGS